MSISIISGILQSVQPVQYSHFLNDEEVRERALALSLKISKTNQDRTAEQIFNDCLLGCAVEEAKRQALVIAGVDCILNNDGNLLIDTRSQFTDGEVFCDIKAQRGMPKTMTISAWEYRNSRNLSYPLYYLGFSVDGNFATYFGYAEAREMVESLKPQKDKYNNILRWADTGKEKRTGWVYKEKMHF